MGKRGSAPRRQSCASWNPVGPETDALAVLPNVFIAGAQKSGTTTLCALLDRHPNVVLSDPKEPVFFSRAANLPHPERYEACFRPKHGDTPQAIIDGSNAYMADPQALSRMRSMLGDDLRFVFCLREPVARAISGYWHQAKKGRERRSLAEVLSFEAATAEEAEQEEECRLRDAAARGLIDLSDSKPRFDDPLWHFRYFRGSVYSSDLERFSNAFGRARVKMILFDELIGDAKRVAGETAAFLGLDASLLPDDVVCHRNPTVLERASGLQRLAGNLPGRHLLRRWPDYETIRRRLLFREPPAPDPRLVERLRQLLLGEVGRLQRVLERDLMRLWAFPHAAPDIALG
jgi:hypothetical protein